MTQLRLGYNSYRDRTRRLSAQRLVNYYAEGTPKESYSPLILRPTPGIDHWADLGAGPIEALHAAGEYLYAVANKVLYRLDSLGRASRLGDLGGAGPVLLEHNTTQLMAVVIGTGAWVWNGLTLAAVTDPDFPAPQGLTFLNGYFIVPVADGRFFLSALNDGTAWDALDFATAESMPDGLVAACTSHGELWLFGQDSTEVFYNSGDADFPFAPHPSGKIERGIAGPRAFAQEDNSIFWLGSDRIVYRAGGYVPQRLSTHAIEQVLEAFDDVSNAVLWSWNHVGHKFIVLDIDSPQVTLVYDVATGLWHERVSLGRTNWRVGAFARAFDTDLAGDKDSGKIGILNPGTYAEWGEPLVGETTAPPLQGASVESRGAILDRVQLETEVGSEEAVSLGRDPVAWLSTSTDGGWTWTDARPARSLGRSGERRERLIWRRLGLAQERTLRFTISDPVPRTLLAAHGDLRGARV